MTQVRSMNDAVARLESGPRSVKKQPRDAGWDHIAVAPGGPEVIYNLPPTAPEIQARFGEAHSSGGFSVGLSAPGGQPPYLYAGIGVQVDVAGRQYLVAKYAVTGDRFSRAGDVLWMDEDVVIPGTEHARAVEERCTHGLLTALEGALLRYRDVLVGS